MRSRPSPPSAGGGGLRRPLVKYLGTIRRTLFAALLAACCCTPFASSPAPARPPAGAFSPERPAHRGGTLVFSDWEFPDTLNLISATAEVDLRVGGLAFAPLWGLDSSLQAIPDLVREVPTVENGDVKLGADGKTMSVDVKLVPGLHWSDGQPITSDDVIFTWKAICDPETQAAATAGFDHVVSMDRRSDTEVVWNLGPGLRGRCGAAADIASGVYAPYLQMGTVMWLMPAHRLAGLNHRDWATDSFFIKPDVVSGPFSVVESVQDDRITLAPNPRFADGRSAPNAYSGGHGAFDHAPYLDKVVFKSYPAKDAMLAGLRAGETDVGFHLTTEDLAGLRSLSGSHTVLTTGLRDEFLNPNHGANTETGKAPPWVGPGGEEPAVLRALDLAVDRQALVQQVLGGAGLATRALYPRALRGLGDAAVSGPGRDLAGARRLLEDAGWKAGPDGVRAKDGRRLAFTLLGLCGNAISARELDLLRQQWAELGAQVKTDCRKRGVFFASFHDGGTNATGAFDMTVYSNTWQPDPGSWAAVGASSQIPGEASPLGQNWNRCRDPNLDAALAAGEATLQADERRRANLAAQKEWLDYRCTLPLFEWPDVRQVSNRVVNFAPNPSLDMDVWNAADWWLRP